MPAVSKKALERLEAKKKLLDQRRNPPKAKAPKFAKRTMLWPVEIATETDGSEPGRDIPYQIEAIDSLSAVREVLQDLVETNKLKSGEEIHVIHVGEPKWLERKPFAN